LIRGHGPSIGSEELGLKRMRNLTDVVVVRPKLVRHFATLRLMGHNARVSLANAVLGEEEATIRRLRRAGRLSWGPGTYGTPAVWSHPKGRECLRAGSYSSLGGTYILGGDHGSKLLTTYPFRINWGLEGAWEDGVPVPTGDTIVGSDVWTCTNCLIMSGVRIGDGAIVAAGAVVTKDVPPYAVVGGNPARLIHYRVDDQQREALLEIRWWEWPRERIRAALPFLVSDDADALIAYARGEARVPIEVGVS
jgi:hypothetical protein